MYLAKARDGYLRWGADGKVRQLEAALSAFGRSPSARRDENDVDDQQLDVAAVVKASQALSSEIAAAPLIERLMTISLENAGADRGLLILPHQMTTSSRPRRGRLTSRSTSRSAGSRPGPPSRKHHPLHHEDAGVRDP